MPDLAKPLREWNKRMEAKLAKRNAPLMDIKELIADIVWKQVMTLLGGESEILEEIDTSKFAYGKVTADKILAIKVGEDRECPECGGSGMERVMIHQRQPKCQNCIDGKIEVSTGFYSFDKVEYDYNLIMNFLQSRMQIDDELQPIIRKAISKIKDNLAELTENNASK